ncbi:MAG: SLBB domain-containing protein [Anaerolineales bacterium]
MKEKWWILAMGVLFGLLSAGPIILVSRPPRGRSIILRPPPMPVPIVVDINGVVHHPGIYSLPLNSRVRDAVNAAGGFSADANSDLINDAALLEDGDHIHVPSKGEE